MNPQTIDLDQAEKAISSLPTTHRQRRYQSKTLTKYNEGRCIYLATFPNVGVPPKDRLLLPHVPCMLI